MSELVAVIGAFGFTGKAITRRLLAQGRRVRTLTNHPNGRDPLGGQIEVAPLTFAAPGQLKGSLEGVETLYNTYWVRFNHGQCSFARAVENTIALIHAAEQAGARRIVHVSVTNPSLDSSLPYFKGKAEVEQAIRESRLSYAIVRPTVVFGAGDILINNIAWALRRFPVFAIPGDGRYRLQPVFVDDVAELAVRVGGGPERVIVDAVGPEIFSYEELVRAIAVAVGSHARTVHVSPAAALWLSRGLGLFVRDVLLTREEIGGLMANLLVSGAAPTGETRFTEWLAANAHQLGQSYASELARHYQ